MGSSRWFVARFALEPFSQILDYRLSAECIPRSKIRAGSWVALLNSAAHVVKQLSSRFDYSSR